LRQKQWRQRYCARGSCGKKSLSNHQILIRAIRQVESVFEAVILNVVPGRASRLASNVPMSNEAALAAFDWICYVRARDCDIEETESRIMHGDCDICVRIAYASCRKEPLTRNDRRNLWTKLKLSLVSEPQAREIGDQSGSSFLTDHNAFTPAAVQHHHVTSDRLVAYPSLSSLFESPPLFTSTSLLVRYGAVLDA